MTYRAEVLADSPVAYWRLSEAAGTSAADETGNGHTGTYTNSPTLGAVGLLEGDADTAVDFDGSNDYVNVPHAAALTPALLTVEAWIRPDSFGATPSDTNGKLIVTKQLNTSGTIDYALFIGNYSGGGQFVGFSFDGVGYVEADYFASLATATTYHIVATRDGTAVNLRVNGVLRATASYSGTPTQSTRDVKIGVSGHLFSTQFFDGRIDEVAIYDHVLPCHRIWQHYKTGQPTLTAALSSPCRGGWHVGFPTF